MHKEKTKESTLNKLPKLQDEDYFNRNKPYIVIPRGIEAYNTLNSMEIDVRWRRASSLGFLTFFTLFWNFIVSIFVIGFIMSGDFSMFLGISVHFLVGIGLMYWTIANYINHTTIFIGNGAIDSEYGPIPIPFKKRIHLPSNYVEQLYVERYVYATSNGKPIHAFRVMVRMKSGTKKELLKGLKSLEHAQYIEQEIEHFLRIEDEAVKGEVFFNHRDFRNHGD